MLWCVMRVRAIARTSCVYIDGRCRNQPIIISHRISAVAFFGFYLQSTFHFTLPHSTSV
jgi:hypothetical protein